METQISLKRASALQAMIRQAIALLDLSSTRDLSIYEGAPSSVIQGFRADFERALARRAALQSALYELRKEVGRANARVGVDDLLADIAQLGAELDFVNGFVLASPSDSEEVLVGRMTQAKAPNQGYLGASRESSISVSLLSAEQIEAFRKQTLDLRRRRQQLQDRVGELNVSTKITPSASCLATLREEGIL